MNYTAQFRTNYFKVKDVAAFRAWVNSFCDSYQIFAEKHHHAPSPDNPQRVQQVADWNDPDNRYGLYSTGETGIPIQRRPRTKEDLLGATLDTPAGELERTTIQTLEGEDLTVTLDASDPLDFDFIDELASHLAEGEVATGMEISQQGMEFLGSCTFVTDSAGETLVTCHPDDLLVQAREKWPGVKIEAPEY